MDVADDAREPSLKKQEKNCPVNAGLIFAARQQNIVDILDN